jgi:hypothetical protein
MLRLLLFTPTTFFTVNTKQGRSSSPQLQMSRTLLGSSLAMAFLRIDTAECPSKNIKWLLYHDDWSFIVAVAGSDSTMADSIDIQGRIMLPDGILSREAPVKPL